MIHKKNTFSVSNNVKIIFERFHNLQLDVKWFRHQAKFLTGVSMYKNFVDQCTYVGLGSNEKLSKIQAIVFVDSFSVKYQMKFFIQIVRHRHLSDPS